MSTYSDLPTWNGVNGLHSSPTNGKQSFPVGFSMPSMSASKGSWSDTMDANALNEAVRFPESATPPVAVPRSPSRPAFEDEVVMEVQVKVEMVPQGDSNEDYYDPLCPTETYDPLRPTDETASVVTGEPAAVKLEVTSPTPTVSYSPSHPSMESPPRDAPSSVLPNVSSPGVTVTASHDSIIKTEESQNPVLPSTDEVLTTIAAKDNELAQAEHELAQLVKEKIRILRPHQPSISHKAGVDSAEFAGPLPRFIGQIIDQNKSTLSAPGDNEEPSYEGALFDRVSAYPFWEANRKSFAAMRPLIRAVVARRKREVKRRELKCIAEYRRRWIEWRKYLSKLQDQGVVDSDSEDLDETLQPKKIAKSLNSVRKTEFNHRRRDPNVRYLTTLAIDPPMESERPLPTFYDYNAIVPNSKQLDTLDRQEDQWLAEEELIFVKQFKKHFKDFPTITRYLPNRSLKDVIKFYYVNKKRLDLRRPAFPDPLALPQDASLVKVSGEITDGANIPVPVGSLPSSNSNIRSGEVKDESYLDSSSEDEFDNVVWSKQEKERYHQAVLKFNRDFDSIASYVRSKTPGQCRAHYSEWTNSLRSPPPPKPPPKPKPSTPRTKPRRTQPLPPDSPPAIDDGPPPEILSPEAPSLITLDNRRLTSSFGLRIATSHWTEEEKKVFMQLFHIHGRSWNRVAEHMGTKTASQLENFFQANRFRLGLDDILRKKMGQKPKVVNSPNKGKSRKASATPGSPPPLATTSLAAASDEPGGDVDSIPGGQISSPQPMMTPGAETGVEETEGTVNVDTLSDEKGDRKRRRSHEESPFQDHSQSKIRRIDSPSAVDEDEELTPLSVARALFKSPTSDDGELGDAPLDDQPITSDTAESHDRPDDQPDDQPTMSDIGDNGMAIEDVKEDDLKSSGEELHKQDEGNGMDKDVVHG